MVKAAAEIRRLISFSPAEVEALRLAADETAAVWRAAGLFPRKVYEVERYEFVREYARGAEPASSEKQQRWLKKIKKELAAKMRTRRK